MRTIGGGTALLALLTLAAPTQAADRALVIGINSYPGITQNGQKHASDLQGAVADAQSFARFLTSKFGYPADGIKLLIDEAASKAAIESAFEDWLVAGTSAGDRALFYFAGHGAQVMDEDGDEDKKVPGDKFDEALAPADATGELAGGPVKIEGLLVDDEIDAMLKKLADRDLMVVVDSCHSGTITRGLQSDASATGGVRTRTLTPRGPSRSRGLVLTDNDRAKHKISTRLIEVIAAPPKAGAAPKTPIVWTATASSQLALDTDSGGLFTQSFLAGITDGRADADRDGSVSASELLDYVRQESESACGDHPQLCKSGLTPTVEAPDDYLKQILSPLDGKPTADAIKQAEGLFERHQDFGVKIEMLPTTAPKLGSSVTFRVTSAEAGALILLDQGPDGSFTQIYPNKFAKSGGRQGHINPSQPLTVPDVYYGFEFEATDKGHGTLIALVAEDAAPIEDIIGKQLDMGALKDPAALLDQLASRLFQPLETEKDTPNRRLRWSFTKLDYEVK